MTDVVEMFDREPHLPPPPASGDARRTSEESEPPPWLDDGPASSEPAPRGEPPILWAPELAKPLPPRVWLSPELTLAPGRAIVCAGKGDSRKGWFAMAMQVCGAAGLKLLGRFAFREEMRSVYFDFEQTELPSRERYQALSRGYGVPLESLGRRLGYRWKPVPSMAPRGDVERQRAIDELSWHTEGLQLAIVDSVRACSPGVDENSVHASVPLDLSTEVSQRTGVAFMFLDHASGKSDDGRARRDSQRGHSSKTDAAQTLLVFSAAEGEPTLVTCERSQLAPREDWPGDFRFTLGKREDGGLYLQEIGAPEARPEPSDEEAAAAEDRRAVDFLRRNPGSSFDELRAGLRMRAQDARAVRDRLQRKGRIRDEGRGKDLRWYPVDGAGGPV